MANTYTKIYLHVVFSTKDCKSLIKPEFEARLWAYLGGIANRNNIKALAVGGTSDHIHLLMSISPTMPVSKAVQLLKGGASKWLNDHFFEKRTFAWQKGYGAFSVNESMVEASMHYINNQKIHHRSKTFGEEYVAFLDRHNINYDSKYILG